MPTLTKITWWAVLIVILALIGATFWVYAAEAGQDIPDAEKWHIGEAGSTSGIFCNTPEDATALLRQIRIPDEEAGLNYEQFVVHVAASGLKCFPYKGAVTFGGVLSDPLPVVSVKLDKTFVIAKFSNAGGMAYAYIETFRVSDQPLIAPTIPAPQVERFWDDRGAHYLTPISAR